MIFQSRLPVSLLSYFIGTSTLFSQSLTVGVGFQNENKIIAIPPNPIYYYYNRNIEYIRALQISAGKKLDEHIEVGGEFSYSWATLNNEGTQTSIGIPINNIGWSSFGGSGKYIFFPQRKLQLGLLTSAGIDIGYPKYMTKYTIERQVRFYAGLHGGVQYQFSKGLNIGYYYGRGKYHNQILLAYQFKSKSQK